MSDLVGHNVLPAVFVIAGLTDNPRTNNLKIKSMKKIFSALAIASCMMLSARANSIIETSTDNTDAHIHGHVIDKATGEHLPYVVVMLKGTTIGVSTENTGHYMIRNVPEGTFTVEVSAIGYKAQMREVTVRKGRAYEVNFILEEDLVQIDGVIVSATRSETTRRMSPTLVNVVGMDVYEKTNSTTVAQGLQFQPGVRIENNCQNCGFQQVRINGLDGQYTQILIDSRPIFSALAGVYGIEQLPANMVDRVEVMRGGGSALFGSSAILSIDSYELIFTAAVTLVLIVLTVIFYHKLFSLTFDERFARSTGTRADAYNLGIAIVTAVVIVIGMKLAGALLMSALIVFPAMSAMRICKSFRMTLIVAAIIAVICAVFGVLLSIILETPVGATIAATDILAYGICALIGIKN